MNGKMPREGVIFGLLAVWTTLMYTIPLLRTSRPVKVPKIGNQADLKMALSLHS